MSESIQVITSDTVKVNVSNSQNDVVSFEKKFDKRITISDLKVSHSSFIVLAISHSTSFYANPVETWDIDWWKSGDNAAGAVLQLKADL